MNNQIQIIINELLIDRLKEVDSKKLESSFRNLCQIYELLSFNYTTNLVKCTTLKLQVSIFIFILELFEDIEIL